MSLTRRGLMAAGVAAPTLAPGLAAATPSPTAKPVEGASIALPAKTAFAAMPVAYLDSGATHPMPLGAKAALEEYLRYKTQDGTTPGYDMGAREEAVLAKFAALVGASPDELCFIQSTTMGENLVLKALDLPRGGGRIVTDSLHFFGSFYTYAELGRGGMDVVTLRATPEGRIDMDAFEQAVTRRTRLVSISLVSTINGFEHDLKRICDIAHAQGAYVYADIVHAAGSVPVDLHASGVDFAACSSYKWLMGDFGLGFLYVRKDVQARIKRPWWGYHQVSEFHSHVFPYDPPGASVADYATSDNATGLFGMGTFSWTGIVQLNYALDWIGEVTVPALAAARQPLAHAVQTELRQRGYDPMTPLDSRTPLVAFALKDARDKLAAPLKVAGVKITLSQNRLRVSLAAFNDMNDIDRLLAALPRTPPV
jgi:selenocysteine lyase/cysteine desulfurase